MEPLDVLKEYFDRVVSERDFVKGSIEALSPLGFTADNTIACVSLCRDEISSTLAMGVMLQGRDRQAGARISACFAVLMLMVACRPLPEPKAVTTPEYLDEIRAWHDERVAKLKAENGWLSLAGLFWLDEGESAFGSADENPIVFPDRAPPVIGTITVDGLKARLDVEEGVEALCRGETVVRMAMTSDADPAVEPDMVTVGDFTFLVIERGGRLALRLYDRQADALRSFTNIETYPVDAAWRIVGRFLPYKEPKTILVPTVIQTEEEAIVPGEIHFGAAGKELRLLPMGLEGSDELFIVFADETSGKETYGGGRFLNAPAPKEGKVVLDFNKAYNPPCAFTPYATCYRPPEENRLPVQVRAGEKKYGKH